MKQIASASMLVGLGLLMVAAGYIVVTVAIGG